MNKPAVQSALHVKETLWIECNDLIYPPFFYTSNIADERVTIYPALQDAGLSILIYNGEADPCVPMTDNQVSVPDETIAYLSECLSIRTPSPQWWTSSMNYTVARPWTAWIAK